MTSPSELLHRLARFGVSVRAEGDNLKVYPPSTWTGWHDAPAEARPLLGELKRRKAEVLAFLQNPTCEVRGKVVQLYHMRPACREAGHCLALTVERDCDLYPVRLGWCRERV